VLARQRFGVVFIVVQSQLASMERRKGICTGPPKERRVLEESHDRRMTRYRCTGAKFGEKRRVTSHIASRTSRTRELNAGQVAHDKIAYERSARCKGYLQVHEVSTSGMKGEVKD
jgi:hypothetical protein